MLMVVANPATSTTLNVASPDGGRVEMDAMSDPRDESRWSADDLITMGFINTPELAALLDNTAVLADLNHDNFDAIVVCGGQSSMFGLRNRRSVCRE
ncbi:type 1 glutamine amidotransferase family protein [Nocardia stercoris]|uniref:Uncharacterized protein n=1 Tax=Nocardia stercoris TaxID=2483361 RepID=A0A3M2L6F9_9NOCA|nr:hypothetical protein [Nocardia stercoris]RMI33211.1 hypothetical protein EBN03_08415 [Nocardia stercoris]